MSKLVKIILGSLAIGVIGIGLFFYFSLFGTPWSKVYYKYQLKDYLDEKYNEEMVITKSVYNFKDSSYGVRAYVKDNPEIEFSAWGRDKTYRDYYPEALWDNQVNNDYQGILEKLYPEAERKRFHGVMGISDEMDISREVPNYQEVDQYFTLVIEENKGLTGEIKEEEINKAYQLIEVFKERNVYFDVLISYYDKMDDTKNAEKYINFDLVKNKKYPTREEIEKIFDESINRNK